MRVLIQRVKNASVQIEGSISGQIGQGLLILLGIEAADTEADISWLVSKVAKLRIFDDEQGVMNQSVVNVQGGILVVSQFTLHASTRKGNRPSYIRAARPEQAEPMYEQFVAALERETQGAIVTGQFGATMQVELLNDGPVTIWIDSKARE